MSIGGDNPFRHLVPRGADGEQVGSTGAGMVPMGRTSLPGYTASPAVDATSAAPSQGFQTAPVVSQTPLAAPSPVGSPAPVASPVDTGTGTGAAATPAATPPSFDPTALIRATPGYQFQVQEGLNALNANAYARGMGNSGATFKALENYGQDRADQYYQQYLNNIASIANGGANAAGALAGVSQNYANATNGVNQTTAGVVGNGLLYNGQATAGMFNNIGNSISQGLGMYQSSLGSPSAGGGGGGFSAAPISFGGAPISTAANGNYLFGSGTGWSN